MQHVLILGKVWPEPSSSAAGARMMQLIEFIAAQRWKISFATSAAENEYITDPRILGVAAYRIELNDRSFDMLLKKLQPTIVIFDRFMTEEQFGWRVEENCPGAL